MGAPFKNMQNTAPVVTPPPEAKVPVKLTKDDLSVNEERTDTVLMRGPLAPTPPPTTIPTPFKNLK